MNEHAKWLREQAANDFTCERPLLEAANEIERLREALVEAEAELIYLRRHGKDGARWEANDSKDVWRDKARSALQQNGSE